MKRFSMAVIIVSALVFGACIQANCAENKGPHGEQKKADGQRKGGEKEDGAYEYNYADPFETSINLLPVSPSIPGPSGLIRNPSAYVLEKWDYNVGVDVVGWQDYVKINVGFRTGNQNYCP